MIKYLLILFFVFSSLAQLQFSQNGSDDEKLRSIVSEKGQAEVVIPDPGNREIDRITRIVSISSVKDKEVRLFLSPLTVEWFISEGFDYRIIERTASKGIISSASLSQAMDWESYPSYTQYDSIMRYFAATYPLLCILDTIGTSINGRLILCLKISDNSGVAEPEPEVFYSSTIHGNETAGFILMLRLADYLLENYTSDLKVKDLVDNLEIWINPLANPDGT
ncbi:MAG: putative zinc-carboxypeptidase precursor (CbpG), partial [Bacteroidetes bacterium]|nr:putative zinc-carboxypeptidase precursor (CbpG) [Bacteroidota bacterium]